MTDYVRIRDPHTGHHLTVTAEQHELFGGEIVKGDAVDGHGRPLPPKYNVGRKTDETTTTTTPGKGETK